MTSHEFLRYFNIPSCLSSICDAYEVSFLFACTRAILNIELSYTHLSMFHRASSQPRIFLDTPVATRRFLPGPFPVLCSPGTERSHDGLTHILMGYRGESTGMMTRHHPATGTRTGDDEIPAVRRQAKPRTILSGYTVRAVPGRQDTEGPSARTPRERSTRTFARANGLENSRHGALVAKPPVNLDKSVERK